MDHLILNNELEISELASLFEGEPVVWGEKHDFWEFVYVDKGVCLVTMDTNQYILQAGEIAFHKPNQFHGLCPYKDGHKTKLIISAFTCQSPQMDYFSNRIISLMKHEKERLYEALHRCQQCMGENPKPAIVHNFCQKNVDLPFGMLQMIKASLETFLLMLLERGDSIHVSERIESYSKKIHQQQLTLNVKTYLEAHLGEILTLEQIAKSLGYSVSQMRKLFYEETGEGIINYFINMKINEAKRMMRDGKHNFTQIAESLGYKDSSYFSRLFKKYQSMTMTEYCNSFKNKIV